MNKDACYQLGYIARTHGLKGEVTAVFTEPVDLEEVQSVFIEIKNALVPHFISSYSDRSDKVFIKFDDINTPEQAAVLKGCGVYLPKTIRPKLKRGEFYNDEIVGFHVEQESGEMLGTVKEVVESGPSRLLAIIHEGKEVLIPVNGPFIKSVNKTKRLIKVSLPEGFLDI